MLVTFDILCAEKAGWCELLEGGGGGFPYTGNCFELVSCVSVRLCFNASFVCGKFRAEG